MAEVGITYEVIREMVALDDYELPPNVVFLGRQFHLPRDKAAFTKLVRSKIWCTYRRGFKAISGTNVMSDQGWGCTLRCGQMMLAEALIRKHLQPGWCWDKKEKGDLRYRTVLSKFLDLKDSSFSIQRIAVQGIDLGRRVGEWFGPNTIAHVLRKLTDLDSWSQVAVHVAADMTIITDEMKLYFTRPFVYHTGKVCVEEEEDNPRAKGSKSGSHPEFNERDLLSGYSVMTMSNSSLPNSSSSSEEVSHTALNTLATSPHNMFQSYADIGTSILRPAPSEDDTPSSLSSEGGDGVMRSVLMMIPLRLGNEKFNPSYWEGLKRCFDLPQCVGIIGGRPRHALWFVGYRGDYLLYFDPHTTQPTVSAEDTLQTPDESYHIDRPDNMHYHELDPSLALGFFFQDLQDFEEFCDRVEKTVVHLKPPLFEVIQSRPHYWTKAKEVKVTEIEPFLLVNAEVPGMEDEEGFVLVEGPEESASSGDMQ